MKGNYTEFETKMNKTISVYTEDLATIRAGRANPAVLDKIKVDYYGSPTPIQQIAGIAVPEPRTITIQPWDATALPLIEKAIQTSELGINPQNDGKLLRINFPPLTEERRKEIVKDVSKKCENAKVIIRNIRRDAMDHFKAAKKNSEITEDDLKDIEKDIQNLTDSKCKEIDSITSAKEKEIMEI